MRSLISRTAYAMIALVAVLLSSSTLSAASITLSNPPLTLTAGQSYQVTANYQTNVSSIVMIQLFDSSWNKLVGEWESVSSSSTSKTLTIEVPSSASAGSTYHWQAVLSNASWTKLAEDNVYSVTIGTTQTSISLNAANTLVAGNTYTVSTDYQLPQNGISTVQLFNSSWTKIISDWNTISAGSGNESFSLTIPSSTPAGSNYIWQAVLSNSSWVKLDEEVRYNITVQASQSSGEWLPAGNWSLEWNDEFSGSGAITKWHPMLGYTPEDYDNNSEKGLRWNGSTENTAQMYSTRTGNHWLNGQGQMVIRAVCDKTSSNANGQKVKTAYLQSGFPDVWDSSEPTNVKWGGKFVSPQSGPLYISARVRTDQVKGHSTWFAFWLFSQTRAYNNNPTDGTEVDVIEIAKGAPNYMNKSFNVANHWAQTGGSNSKQFSTGTNPTSTSFVDVTDSNYHIYGIEWTTTSMKCYVDGQLYYTFTDHIPSNPVDMMMLLTMEFQVNAWDPNQGDGRSSGPYVSNNSSTREMSRALVDYVRVYRK